LDKEDNIQYLQLVGLNPLPTQLNELLKNLTFLFIFFTLCLPSITVSNTISEKIHFNVYRNDSLIGYHNLDFYERDGLIESKIAIKFEVTFLGFVVYEYLHKNHEKWMNNTLVFMEASTDKNGDLLDCKVNKKEDQFKILGTNGDLTLDKKITPTTYWKFDQLITGEKNKVLNSQDCSYLNFEIKYLGDEMIYDNSLKASRYKLLGKEFTGDDVNIDIWYKDEKWVKMIFLKDGSTVEYFLKEYDTKDE
jgi:hypothetical protein